MYHLFGRVLFFGVLALLGSCVGTGGPSSADTIVKADRDESPSEVFQKYWVYSKEGKGDEVIGLLAPPPPIFLQCYSMNESECDKKVANDGDQKKEPGTFELVSKPDNFMIKDRVPSGIKQGFWSSYTVNKERIKQDQARVNITVKGSGFVIDRDVLFYKQADGWKVIAIVDPGDSAGYSPIG